MYYTSFSMDDESKTTGQLYEPAFPEMVRPGAILGNYRLDVLIGAGLLSEVYDGLNILSHKRCAIKVFRKAASLGPVHYGRYVHEAKQVALLGHVNIAEVYNYVNSEGLIYTVMERLDGPALTAVVRKNAPLSRQTFFPIIQGLCLALAETHAHGIAHKHLHGNQVIVQWRGKEPTVKILDFGTHHLLPGVKEESPGLIRRPEHALCIAPEQAKGQEGDTRSDIYALCVLLYEMVTGKVPFLGDTFASTLEQHIAETPHPPGNLVTISPELERTILRGLEKDPRQRIPSVEALLAALDPLSVTGQFQVLGKGTTKSGHGPGLAPTPSRELELKAFADPAMNSAGQADRGSPAQPDLYFSLQPSPNAPHARHPLRKISVPKNRSWLFIILGMVILICALILAFVFWSGGEKSASPPRPTPSKRAPSPSHSP